MRKNNNKLLEVDYLKQLFDIIRIVDPIKKIVIEENGKVIKENIKCFKLCNRDSVCENCISIRAYNQNTSVMKFEYINNKVYMIMATPLNGEKSNYVMETIRDITDCKIIDSIEVTSIDEIKSTFNKMNRLIITDELTQCYNRRYINERLPIDIDLAINNNLDLSIAMIDIDLFKNINDEYGHLAGDFVLKEISKLIKNNIRIKNDWIARYGGEEFLVLFKNTDKEDAYILSKRIKSIVEGKIIKYNNVEIKITISVGVASLSKKVNTMNRLISIADKKLYKAKISGRNSICM
ncbi:GGDEF domain-containing protein [Clostridium sp. D53t1_180928_C8]|uniref:diguanylate cyclase n=1 Tax=Clostridium sp. D53t1_180928_C8 TaxID=2787101 RepID=UPI0018A98DAF